MRKPYILTGSPDNNILAIPPSESAHLTRVLRASVGFEFIAFDGNGHSWSARIDSINRDRVFASVLQSLPDEPLPLLSLTVAVGAVKRTHMEWAIEKSAETGVRAFLPLLTEFAVVEPGTARIERWQSIALSAAKQSRRTRLMEIQSPSSLAQLLIDLPANTPVWALDLDPDAIPLRELAQTLPAGSLTLIVGPEGGFSPAERGLMYNSGVRFASLGRHPLRTETAVAVAAAYLLNIAPDKP